ncbi:chemotaxis response regulator protein-glutamate methylesterase [Sphaerospermopsis aphanizomenoides BCCUSP55]|uniref:chemotaxis response regulator protein-glutamate methylesterase n=1 Tax=Sphaerospermopsis aphanizomenoides TaxID=459663 RepID=UPI0019041A36|nr:chemotaxis response regulator protein-glutamate methylesterase [Sphaerospermopsis aphanizomenoides]MBK1988980.1 chemotaxis response regulator protein-glutamate methylesterase [Sphaerospermopsis aphanizomenoides BCCUSP55]
MRIAIVNDLIIAVEALRRILAKVPEYDLAWIAYDGVEAVAKCAEDTPDLILMDVLMPNMDGVEATQRIMSQSPCAILMVTASVNRYAAKVFAAMGYGALDAVNTPAFGLGEQTESSTRLLKKIATIARLIGKSSRGRSQFEAPLQPKTSSQPNQPLIVIGSSTGGPQALVTILSQFPQNLNASIVIVQHLDAQFAQGFATWLDGQISLPVSLAMPGYLPTPGKVLVAGTNYHLVMRSDQTLDYQEEPLNSFYHPSVDVFFSSVAKYWQGTGIGVLLTGMGRDGAQGLKLLKDQGWHTIVQDSKTCVVYGMPKAAVELGAATEILPVEAIAQACTKSLTRW